MVQHYLIWSQLLLLFIFHFHRNNYSHSLFWIHIRATPIGSFELPIPSCMGLQRHNVHFSVSGSASKITFFISAVIYSSVSEPVWSEMEAGDSFDSLKPWPQKIPSQVEQGSTAWPQFSRAGERFQLPVRPREEVCHITSGCMKQSPRPLAAQNHLSGGFLNNPKGLFPLLVCVGAALCEQMEVCVFTPTQEPPQAPRGWVWSARCHCCLFCGRCFSWKCNAERVYLSETGTSKFSVRKNALPKWCSACTELALSSASFQHSSKALSAVVWAP